LTENLNFNALASYEHSKFNDPDTTDDTYLVSTGLGYTLSSQARAFMSYAFQLRDSTNHDDSFTENAVTIGLIITY
jgi:uncharacterized protein (PEP-CTERM system associated)